MLLQGTGHWMFDWDIPREQLQQCDWEGHQLVRARESAPFSHDVFLCRVGEKMVC